MKTITFKQLCRLVSKVDYLCPDSYPINFAPENGNGEYKVGIGYLDTSDTTDDIEGVFCGERELQYLAKWDEVNDGLVLTFMDVQDPDNMIYGEIVEMLKKHCNINENSKIYLYDDEYESFNGEQECIFWDDCSEELKYKELNHPCRKCIEDFCLNCKKLELFNKEVK